MSRRSIACATSVLSIAPASAAVRLGEPGQKMSIASKTASVTLPGFASSKMTNAGAYALIAFDHATIVSNISGLPGSSTSSTTTLRPARSAFMPSCHARMYSPTMRLNLAVPAFSPWKEFFTAMNTQYCLACPPHRAVHLRHAERSSAPALARPPSALNFAPRGITGNPAHGESTNISRMRSIRAVRLEGLR